MRLLMAEILAAWRRAERLTDELPEGSPEQAAAVAACQRLRDLYHELTESGAVAAVSEADARVILAELAE
jgi:hypothetical protein